MATGLANLLLGADFTQDDPFCDTLINDFKNHWRMSDPCTNLTQIQPGMIVSDSDDEHLYHYWAAECRMILQEQDNVFIVDPGGGGHYTTIQTALDAENAGGELFLVAPNDYDGDTIDFTANNQCVRGEGLTPQADVHAADAAICDFGAYTGCKIENIMMRMTDPTTAKDMITGSGSLELRWCHLEVNVDASGPAGADQPTCIDTTGDVLMILGNIVYTNSKDDAAAIKAPIRINAGADVCLHRVIIDIDGSNQALATTPAYGTAGLICLYRCEIDVADNGATNTIGLAYSNIVGGAHEFMGNRVKVSNTSNDAFGLYLLSTENVRSMFNHYHITGDEAFSFYVAAGATVVSQLDDIIAADGPTGTIANITWMSSEVDGEQSISRYLNFNPAMLTGEWGAKFMSIADGAGDPTYSLIVQSDAEGIANSSDLRIGLDPSLYNMIVLPRANIGDDLGLGVSSNPSILIFNNTADDYIAFFHSGVDAYIRTNSGGIRFQDNIAQDITYWENIGAGNPYFYVYGFKAADAVKYGRMSVDATGDFRIESEERLYIHAVGDIGIVRQNVTNIISWNNTSWAFQDDISATFGADVDYGLKYNNTSKLFEGTVAGDLTGVSLELMDGVIKKTIDFDDASPVAICTVADGYVVTDVWIEITTIWDGNGTITIGDGGDAAGFLTDAGINQGVAAYYGFEHDTRGAYLWDNANSHERDKIYTGADTVDATLVVGTSTQGTAVVYVHITRLN